MPNWCYNTMLVAGNKTELRKFLKAIKNEKDIKADPASALDNDYDLNKLVPLDPRSSVVIENKHTNEAGEEVKHTFSAFATKERDGFDGYANALDVWGSKWGACNVEIDDPTSYPLFIRYETAWSPASQLIIDISKQFPNLAFAVAFDEEGHQFCGWELIADGDIVERGEVNTDNMPHDLQKLYDEACDKDESELWDEYYELHNDWRNDNQDRMITDSEICLAEYMVWKRKADRQRKEGRRVESFIPSV